MNRFIRTATLSRSPDTDQGTIGRLTAHGLPPLATIEPPWRNNSRNVSCIPRGVYDVAPHLSPRFGRCLLVLGTEPRTWILFHCGNYGGDTAMGYRTHTAGCILPGEAVGVIAGQRAVLRSRFAFSALMDWADDRWFRLDIR